jgi:hypothetical protein
MVTGAVTECVIHVLEIIKVDVQRRALRPVAVISFEQLIDAVDDERSIG